MIDNDVYNRLGETWWDEDNFLNMLHGSCTPGRMAYFEGVLRDRLDSGSERLEAIDIGCGCGFLAEEFARFGFSVTGVDPSPVAIEAATRHAVRSELDIDYRVGAGEDIPAGDGAFDLAYCCEVLEHVSDLRQVIRETARVLRPGGLYLFDTVNRTLASKLLAIKVMQEWRWTRISNLPLHSWDMFVRPQELTALLEEHGLKIQEIVGLAPRANPVVLLSSFAQARRGAISYGALSRRLNFGRVKPTWVSYMGYAIKR